MMNGLLKPELSQPATGLPMVAIEVRTQRILLAQGMDEGGEQSLGIHSRGRKKLQQAPDAVQVDPTFRRLLANRFEPPHGEARAFAFPDGQKAVLEDRVTPIAPRQISGVACGTDGVFR